MGAAISLILKQWKVLAVITLLGMVLTLGWKVKGWRDDSLLLGPVQAELASVTAQRDALKTAEDGWISAAKVAEERVAAAEARQPQIVERIRTVVQTIHDTAPPPDATCPDLLAWERIQFNLAVSRWGGTP